MMMAGRLRTFLCWLRYRHNDEVYEGIAAMCRGCGRVRWLT